MNTQENNPINSPGKGRNFQEMAKFAMVGLLSTLIDIVLLRLCLYLGVNVYLATAIGFLCGLINGYLLNSYFVFKQVKSGTRYLKYLTVSLLGLLWTELIVDLLHVRSGRFSAMGAKLVAVVIVYFWNYFLSKKWAFK